MAIAIAAILFSLIAGSIIWFGYRQYAKPATVAAQLSAPIPGHHHSVIEAPVDAPRMVHFLQWVGEKVPINPIAASITRRQLIAAGFYSDGAVPVYVSLRIVTMAVFVLVAMVATSFSSWRILFVYASWIASGAVGFLLTTFALEMAMNRHQENLRIALPDCLDLLVVCVEAGLGLDQAIKKVADELRLTHPALCRELSFVSMEMRTGIKRADAMRNMADRTMEPEVRKFVAIMVQTDRFGTSIAESLRAHADFMRMRRRQMIEEKANKLGVKMTIIVFFFIMPAIIVVSGGPAFLAIMKELLPMMGRGHGR